MRQSTLLCTQGGTTNSSSSNSGVFRIPAHCLTSLGIKGTSRAHVVKGSRKNGMMMRYAMMSGE